MWGTTEKHSSQHGGHGLISPLQIETLKHAGFISDLFASSPPCGISQDVHHWHDYPSEHALCWKKTIDVEMYKYNCIVSFNNCYSMKNFSGMKYNTL